ncbi:MAG: DUF4837 family protein [Bacteroidales bacterium]|nr:DUF4837 family protein [Bacteroidales bacterium]
MKNAGKLITVYLIAISFGVLFSGCTNFDRSGLQPSTGGTNELLIVTNSEAMWKGKIGQTISAYFGQDVPGLPQPESMFNMAHISEENLSKMLRIHHNVFIVDINKEFEEPVLETKIDFWSSPQRVVKMTVADEAAFYKEFDKNKEAFLELFNANERRRVNLAYSAIEDFKITQQINENFDLDILIPKSFYVATTSDNFMWLRREAERFSQAIMIYTYPYTDTIAFNYDRIIEVRDSVTRQYVPGPSEGSYMKVSMIEPPVSKTFDFNGHYAVEMRGLWDLEGDFMGGPFLGYTLVDSRNNRVITVDAYVYNPSQEKRDLIRQLEALIYTLAFPEKEDVAEVK